MQTKTPTFVKETKKLYWKKKSFFTTL